MRTVMNHQRKESNWSDCNQVDFLSGTPRCRAEWLASLPQLVSSTGDTPGQHWRLQEGREPLNAPRCDWHNTVIIFFSTKSTSAPQCVVKKWLFVQCSSSWMQRRCLSPWRDSDPPWTQSLWPTRATLRSCWRWRYSCVFVMSWFVCSSTKSGNVETYSRFKNGFTAAVGISREIDQTNWLGVLK